MYMYTVEIDSACSTTITTNIKKDFKKTLHVLKETMCGTNDFLCISVTSVQFIRMSFGSRVVVTFIYYYTVHCLISTIIDDDDDQMMMIIIIVINVIIIITIINAPTD